MTFPRSMRKMSIRQKLRVSFVLTTAIALIVAAPGILGADYLLFYRSMTRDLSTLTRIVGDNTVGALAFEDAKIATESLATLAAKPRVQAACLYRPDGRQFAIYRRPDYSGACPWQRGDKVQGFQGGLIASHAIQSAGRHIGDIVVLHDLEEIPQRLLLYGAVVIAALILASIVALVVSSRLRALIAGPILELAHAADEVTHTKDYRIRARKMSEDEVGELADALNQMLAGIESRDQELQKALATQQETTSRLAQLNSELQRSNAELERSNKDLERFAFVASHDLQEPLRMITTFSQLLATRSLEGSSGLNRDYLEHIVSGTRRMRDLLADLLAYTQVAGSSEPPRESVDLNLVLARVQDLLSVSIAESNAEIMADSLPVLIAHEGRLISLFSNLLSNSIKYRSAERPCIQVSAMVADGEYVFSFKDNGIGIALEYHAKIFDPFKRLHSREVPGTGVGLAICQRIVDRYGGRIWVSSQEGAGSTFYFTLPLSMGLRVA